MAEGDAGCRQGERNCSRYRGSLPEHRRGCEDRDSEHNGRAIARRERRPERNRVGPDGDCGARTRRRAIPREAEDRLGEQGAVDVGPVLTDPRDRLDVDSGEVAEEPREAGQAQKRAAPGTPSHAPAREAERHERPADREIRCPDPNLGCVVRDELRHDPDEERGRGDHGYGEPPTHGIVEGHDAIVTNRSLSRVHAGTETSSGEAGMWSAVAGWTIGTSPPKGGRHDQVPVT